MAGPQVARVLALIVIAIILQASAQKFNVPEVKIEVFQPKGFRASIPGELLLLFRVNGHLFLELVSKNERKLKLALVPVFQKSIMYSDTLRMLLTDTIFFVLNSFY